MKRIFFYLTILITLQSWFCTTPMLKDDEINSLQESYNGVYVLLQDADIGNGKTLKAGTKIKLYFKSGTGSVKVYAYLATEERETALGKNILYLFDTDFPEAGYSREFLERKLNKLVRPVK